MIPRTLLLAALLLPLTTMAESPVAIAIHGGAGTIERGQMTEEREAVIRDALDRAVHTGHGILVEGGTSLDAVTAAVRILEDAEVFNAGRGSVLTNAGTIEMDASIMDGATLDAGAVAGVRGIRHPIEAARLIMTDSPHVMMAGRGAEEFARGHDLEFKDDDWFMTDFRRQQLRQIQARESAEGQAATELSEDWFSTVGAVAVDSEGNVAAATSTGGMSNKRWGRVGDSPIIGAGTYADNRACAVSGTGHGEYFIRHAVAYNICARVLHAGKDLATAADEVIHQVLTEAGADGGVISIDAHGNIAMPFNTAGMYRAAIHPDGSVKIGIYRDED